MRKMAGIGSALGALASLGLDSALLAVEPLKGRHHAGRTRYPKGQRPRRSWYVPHQGPREIERRQRQAERDLKNQQERADSNFGWQIEGAFRVSRRGRVLETAEQSAERGA